MKADSVETVLLVCKAYPPFGGDEAATAAQWVQSLARIGHRVEVVALSDSDEEFVHLDSGGNLVHRIVPARSYTAQALRALAPRLVDLPLWDGLCFGVRAAEKVFELRRFWNRGLPLREVALSQLALVAPAAASALWDALGVNARTERRHPVLPAAVRSFDVVICTYDRLDELLISIDSALGEVDDACAAGVAARLRVIYQNAGLPERIAAVRPELLKRPNLAFELSLPPSLTGARNFAVASSKADLIAFIDDDVELRPGFLGAYLEAAQRHPDAIGFAGRIESPSEPKVGRARAIGQIRATGHVDINYNSQNRDLTFVPMTPMGANMAFRRERMNRLFGKAWFDASLTGSAIREESTLALAVNRAGEHFVFVPGAALEHFEAQRGGCRNRDERSPWERVQHRALETLFLARLYEGTGWLHAAAAARVAAEDLRRTDGAIAKLGVAAVHLAGYAGARRRWRAVESQPAPMVSA